MNKIVEAKYLDGYVSINDYKDFIHYQRIYCPECNIAPIHIVRKQNIRPYFASNRKEEHQSDCQYYEEFIDKKRLNYLIESKDEKNQERLKFLIESNLNSSIRLMLNASTRLINEEKRNHTISKKDIEFHTQNKYKKESITRVNIKNIGKNQDNIDNFIIVYGHARLNIKNQALIDKQRHEEYYTKKLIMIIRNYTLLFHTKYLLRQHLLIFQTGLI